ncbi:MAG TPA: hypothetical protein VF039_01800 [Longimicrobiales bacterium]
MARWVLLVLALAVVATLIFLAGRGSRLPAVTEDQVRTAITAAIQREAREQFLVTGRLDVVASATVENRKIFLPSLLGLNLGSARSTVTAPGRVYYGFDVRELTQDMITLVDDSTVHVRIPDIHTLAVEPALDRMVIDTDVAWSRSDETEREVERRAIVEIMPALRAQGQAHLRDSTQPRINTAEALRHVLEPTVQALGIERPNFRFDISGDIEMRSGRD